MKLSSTRIAAVVSGVSAVGFVVGISLALCATVWSGWTPVRYYKSKIIKVLKQQHGYLYYSKVSTPNDYEMLCLCGSKCSYVKVSKGCIADTLVGNVNEASGIVTFDGRRDLTMAVELDKLVVGDQREVWDRFKMTDFVTGQGFKYAGGPSKGEMFFPSKFWKSLSFDFDSFLFEYVQLNNFKVVIQAVEEESGLIVAKDISKGLDIRFDPSSCVISVIQGHSGVVARSVTLVEHLSDTIWKNVGGSKPKSLNPADVH